MQRFDGAKSGMWELQWEALCENDAEKKQRDALRMGFRDGVGRKFA